MKLPDESLRPTRAIATPPNEPTKRLKFSDEEWLAHIKDEADHKVKMAELAKTQYLRDRKAAYEKEINPFLSEAQSKSLLDNDDSLVKELRAKKLAIEAKFPQPV